MAKDKYIISEIAEITEKKVQTIRERLFNIAPVGTVTVNYKETKVYAFSSLPKDYQEKILAADSIPAQPVNETSPVSIPEIQKENITPAAGAIAESMFTNCRQASTPAGLFQPEIMPAVKAPTVKHLTENERKIALARYDLIINCEKFYLANQAVGKVAATDQFVEAYNTGRLYPQIYSIIGSITRSTIYNWRKILDNSTDYTKLVPMWGNHCRPEKLTPELKDLILAMLLNENKPPVATVYRKVKNICRIKNIPLNVHEMTVYRFVDNFRKEFEYIWCAARNGLKAVNDQLMFYIERDPSKLSVGSCLVGDGHKLNMQVINPWTGKPGRAAIYAFIDWKSGYLTGYEIMFNADTQCVCSAYRNARIALNMPIESVVNVMLDNGREAKNKFFLEDCDLRESGITGAFGRTNATVTFTEAYHGQSKVIERFWKEFTATFERFTSSFTGSSIGDKPASMMRNEKFHKMVKDKFIPTIEQLIEMIEQWRKEFHRYQPCSNVKGKTIGEIFDEGRGAGIEIDLLDDLLLAEKKAKLNRNGVKLFGSYYWAEELFGRRREEANVIIRYSLADLTYIKVYDEETGEFIARAEITTMMHPLARTMGNEYDMEALKRQLSKKNRLKRMTKEALILAEELKDRYRDVITIKPDVDIATNNTAEFKGITKNDTNAKKEAEFLKDSKADTAKKAKTDEIYLYEFEKLEAEEAQRKVS
ncbi:MAG: Mu transposase C-terminal domain-containing protein [Candidatus Wallbacteria bacterium]